MDSGANIRAAGPSIATAIHRRSSSLYSALSTPVSPGSPARALFRRDSYVEAVSLLGHDRNYASLLFVPFGVVLGVLGGYPLAVFALNFAALIPLSLLITESVIQLSYYAGPIKGGILRAVLGNTVELFTGAIALSQGHDEIVRELVIGSVLSYSLLVLGGCFLYASYGKKDVEYDKKLTSIMTTLVMLVSIILVMPTIMLLVSRNRSAQVHGSKGDMLILSHGVAIVLLLLFCIYLVFRFHTHHKVFEKGRSSTPRRSTTIGLGSETTTGPSSLTIILIASAFAILACASFLLSNLSKTAKILRVSKSFLGIVVIPMVGNLGKAIRVIRRSRKPMPHRTTQKSNLNEPIRLIMTNILDTLLFITPLLVLFGWVVGQPMGLDFGLFDSIIFLIVMMILTYLLDHGKTTYFEGCMLIGTYIILVVAFYVRPDRGKHGQALEF